MLVHLEVLSPDWAPCRSVVFTQLAILFYETFLLCVYLKKCVYVCVRVCTIQVPREARRGDWIPWSWS